jgi:hypothetical protein
MPISDIIVDSYSWKRLIYRDSVFSRVALRLRKVIVQKDE